MYKNATYKEKFADLREWLPYIMESVKKDLKNEHLKQDLFFVKKFLASKNIHKITAEELAQAYEKAIQEEERGEDLAEFITSRWLLKHTDLYEFFEKSLTQIDANFTELEEIQLDKAQILTKEAIRQFGAPHTYLFSVLNSVVLPKESFQQLKLEAQQHQENESEVTNQRKEQESIEKLRSDFEQELARTTDKFEKKLSGLQKKYITDTESFKKQIAQLQRKLNEKKV